MQRLEVSGAVRRLKEGMLWIFPAGKIRRLRSGANPRSWVPEASMLTRRPPKPLRIGRYFGSFNKSKPAFFSKFLCPLQLMDTSHSMLHKLGIWCCFNKCLINQLVISKWRFINILSKKAIWPNMSWAQTASTMNWVLSVIYSTCRILHVSAAMCHLQGAF
jgi:hypothetical protein